MDRMIDILPKLRNNAAFKYTFCVVAFLLAFVIRLMLDRYLPRYDVTIVEHTVVEADPATTWRALLGLDLGQVHTPLMDTAMAVRRLPARVRLSSGSRMELANRAASILCIGSRPSQWSTR